MNFNNFFLKKDVGFYFNKFKFLFFKNNWNLFSGFGEEIKKVKSM